jgi:hypothetical protein
MSLLDDADPGHEPELIRLAAELEAGSREERAVLLNLREEDRVPAVRARFQLQLVTSTRVGAVERVRDACSAAPCALPVPAGRRAVVRGPWWVYVKLDALLAYGFVDPAGIDRRSPPRRLRLDRPWGRPGRAYWTTSTLAADATAIRDRLGLTHFERRSQVYRLTVDVETDPARLLFIPTAIDSDGFAAWRRPPPGHADPWGLTRNLSDDAAAEPELLALPEPADPREAVYVGEVATAPPNGYLAVRFP